MNKDLPEDKDEDRDRPAGWSRFSTAAGAARRRLQPESDAAPYGFATRIAARWAELRRNERFQLFQRWSIRAAFASLLLLAATWAIVGRSPATAGPAPIEVPEVPLSLP